MVLLTFPLAFDSLCAVDHFALDQQVAAFEFLLFLCVFFVVFFFVFLF